MPNNYEVALSGVLALLILKEVFRFLRTKKDNNKPAGEFSPEYWQSEQRRAMTEVLVATIIPILSNQTTIMSDIRTTLSKQSESLVVILDRISR